MLCHYACRSPEHALSRRAFLAGAAGAVGGLGFADLLQPHATAALAREQKRVLVVWLSGGVSQLETWDPKPGTDTGGPFQTIATSVPGIHISELLPYTAKQMHRLALVRGINTTEDDHGKGYVIMHTGRRPEPAMTYPHLGSVCAKLLGEKDNPLPGYIHVTPRGNGGINAADAAFLGPRYASMKQRGLFDTSKEPPVSVERYGRHDFGRHCLMARRLLEGGATFVKVTHTNYDTHHENFDFHIEQLGEFDRPFATLLDDLHERGLLASTLVVVMSEFGRTPRINQNYGRDHWSRAWSVALGGCGIRGGSVVGKTNANGTAVTDRQVHGGHLFHTYLKALGLDPKKNFYIDDRPIPRADPKASAIKEVLA
jgi:hypothetical protein